MADVTTKKCDVCDRLRVKDSNHWFQGIIGRHGLFVGLLDGGVPEEYARNPIKHFCGQHCVSSWFVSELGKIKGDS